MAKSNRELVGETQEKISAARREIDAAFQMWRGAGRAGDGGTNTGIMHAWSPMHRMSLLLGGFADPTLPESVVRKICEGVQELIPAFKAKALENLH